MVNISHVYAVVVGEEVSERKSHEKAFWFLLSEDERVWGCGKNIYREVFKVLFIILYVYKYIKPTVQGKRRKMKGTVRSNAFWDLHLIQTSSEKHKRFFFDRGKIFGQRLWV